MNHNISISELILALIGLILILYNSIAAILSTNKIASLPNLYTYNNPRGLGFTLSAIAAWAYMLCMFYFMWKRYKKHKMEFP